MSVSQIPHTFGASTTAAEIIDGVDLHGRRAVVTGASSGIGVETARALAAAGADVTLAVRNTDAGDRVAARLEEELPPKSGKLTVGRLDLADRSTVETFVADWTGPLHILVNNAGVMAPPELTRTPDGRETQFGVNHLGHFALATGLSTRHSRRRTAHGSSRSPRSVTSSHRSSSTTWTTASAPTTPGPPTVSRRPPTSCSPSAPPSDGPTTASPPTR